MNTTLTTLLAPAAAILVGLVLFWWLSKRLTKPGVVRTLVRLVGLAAVALVGVTGGLTLMRSQIQAAAATTSTPIVSERASVDYGELTVTLDAVGSLEPGDTQNLTFSASAPVTEVLVSVGDYVHAGDVLARVDTTDLEANLRDAQLSLAQAQASLDALTAPASELDIAAAEANITLAQAQLYSASQGGSSEADVEIARLQEELARNSLWQAQINRDMRVEQEETRGGGVNWLEQQQYDSSVNQAENSVTLAEMDYEDTVNSGPSGSSLASANASVASAQARLEELQSGPSETDLRRAQISVESAQLEVDNAQEALDDATLVAPFDGIVAEENLIVGVVPPSASAITLIDVSNYRLNLSVAESDVINVALGQPVDLAVQAINDAPVSGTITALDVSPTQSGQLISYAAEVTVNPTEDVALRPGMSATATITLESYDNILVLPNRFIETDATTGGAVVQVETEPGVYTAVPVTIGARNSEESEITSGLSAGQTVVVLTRETSTTTEEQSGLGFGIAIPGGGGPPAGGGNFTAPAGGGGFSGRGG
ncbi:MAG: efflux RND transporter periplasmic adaptor subunit [Anaerolineae bacterium]|nr:efflux RND transporter periplasmic adaptor subunit [Anaerolineae bacterium]